jgi:hypothetical protein
MATPDFSKLTTPELLKKIKLVKILFAVFVAMMIVLIGISLYMVFVEKKSMTTLIIGVALLATLPMNIKNIRALEEERKQRGK